MGATQTHEFSYLPWGYISVLSVLVRAGIKGLWLCLFKHTWLPGWKKKLKYSALIVLDKKKTWPWFRVCHQKSKKNLSNRKILSKRKRNAIYKDNLPLTLSL